MPLDWETAYREALLETDQHKQHCCIFWQHSTRHLSIFARATHLSGRKARGCK
jgi:hypothetical protein